MVVAKIMNAATIQKEKGKGQNIFRDYLLKD
jgi:hypothetical protein